MAEARGLCDTCSLLCNNATFARFVLSVMVRVGPGYQNIEKLIPTSTKYLRQRNNKLFQQATLMSITKFTAENAQS